MSGHVFGTEIKLTKRYHLGRLAGWPLPESSS